MNRIQLGVRLESFGLPLRRALAEAARLGVAGVQADAAGDLAPKALSQTGRREFRRLLRTHNLELTAVGCPLRYGLDAVQNKDARIDHVRQVMTLSYDLGPRLVIVEAGRVPEDVDGPAAKHMSEALLALGHHGDRTGTVLALETGLEPGDKLRQVLDRCDTGGLGVNLDPANLLVNGFDPYAAARALAGKVRHSHARDARLAGASRSAQEVPLGHGDIDWMQWLGVLEEIEYRGWLVIEREGGEQRVADLANGVALLRRLMH